MVHSVTGARRYASHTTIFLNISQAWTNAPERQWKIGHWLPIPGHLKEGLAMSLGSRRGKRYLKHRMTQSLLVDYFLINLSHYYFFGCSSQEYIKKRSPVGKSLNFSLPKGWTAAGHRNMLDNLSSLKKQHCPLMHTMMGRTRACYVIQENQSLRQTQSYGFLGTASQTNDQYQL